MEWQTNDYQVGMFTNKQECSGRYYISLNFYRLIVSWHTDGDGFNIHCTGCCWFSLSIGRFEISILR